MSDPSSAPIETPGALALRLFPGSRPSAVAAAEGACEAQQQIRAALTAMLDGVAGAVVANQGDADAIGVVALRLARDVRILVTKLGGAS